MHRRFLFSFLLAVAVLFSSRSFSQNYIVNGNASQYACNCYLLTQPALYQAGSVWNAYKINLNNPFDFTFNVYIGCLDGNGADGIVFILQPISTSIGTTGEGMGFGGVSPSVGIALDTWQNPNLNDPAYDHISIQLNGVVVHGNDLAGPTQISATSDNVEDCAWHTFRIKWDPATHIISTYFDGQFRLQGQKDLVADVFNNNPLVYWGFSGATGGAYNLQQFCTILNSNFYTNFSSNSTCIGNPVTFYDSSQSFSVIQNYYWDFGDGTTSTLAAPPPHTYSNPGSYLVQHVITGQDGCVSDTAKKTIIIGAKPVADFDVYDTCANNPVRVSEHSTCSFGNITQWTWLLDRAVFSTAQQPILSNLSAGPHQLQLAVTSNYGCSSDTVSRVFQVISIPVIDFSSGSGCVNQPVQFTGIQIDNATLITQWNWNFADGTTSQQPNPSHIFNNSGSYGIIVTAIANGCPSVPVLKSVIIGVAPVADFEVHDTCEGNSPGVINRSSVSGGTITQWNWTLNGQPFSTSQTPVFTALPSGNYILQLTATGNTGCVSNPATQNFIIKNKPLIIASGSDACYKQPVQFNASQTDTTTITRWNWNFGDAATAQQKNPVHTFNTGGTYSVTVSAKSSDGCVSNVVTVPVKIEQLTVNAGRDTVVVANSSFALNGSATSSTNSSLSYLWSPATGLNDPTLLRPLSTLQNDIVYTLTVSAAQGCTVEDSVKVAVFKNSAIYVPTAFTPNNDGLNDVLIPKYVGIKLLNYFVVYNRWGQTVFKTTDMSKGWDGTVKAVRQNTETFVWIIKAEDYTGKILELRGITTIVR